MSSVRATLGGGSDSRLAELIEAFPAFSEPERRLAENLYRLLAQGRPVTTTRLAQHSGLPIAQVEPLLSDLSGMLRRDENGQIVAFLGLDIRPSHHRLIVGRRTLYAWCALDTLLIPSALGKSVEVRSVSPLDASHIGFTVTARGLTNLHPADVLVSLLLPDGDAWRRDVDHCFCRFVHFFRNVDEATRWRPDLSHVFFLPVERAYLLAAVLSHRLFGENCRPH